MTDTIEFLGQELKPYYLHPNLGGVKGKVLYYTTTLSQISSAHTTRILLLPPTLVSTFRTNSYDRDDYGRLQLSPQSPTYMLYDGDIRIGGQEPFHFQGDKETAEQQVRKHLHYLMSLASHVQFVVESLG